MEEKTINETILSESRKQMDAAVKILFADTKLGRAVKEDLSKQGKLKTITEAIEKSSTIHLLLESLAAGPFKEMMNLQLKSMVDWGKSQGIEGSDEDIVNKVITMSKWHNEIWPAILKMKRPDLINK